MDTPCIHNDGINGLTVTTCTICLASLARRNYSDALITVMPSWSPLLREKKKKKCEMCHLRGANKGNRITVKLPRPPMGAFGTGIPPYPPTFMGPTFQARKVYEATHRANNGKWACDRCDPGWAEARPPIRYTPRDRTNVRAIALFE